MSGIFGAPGVSFAPVGLFVLVVIWLNCGSELVAASSKVRITLLTDRPSPALAMTRVLLPAGAATSASTSAG